MNQADDFDIDSLILIVVGAHLRAEVDDRPLAYRLRDRIRCWVQAHQPAPTSTTAHVLQPVVCTDVWYLNNNELLARPVISIGEPGVNAATAFLSTRLPTALVIDQALRIHLDPEHVDSRACLWGVNPQTTATAVDLFIERFLDQFMAELTE